LINCALVGFGKWGKIIYKSIQKNNFLNLKYVCYNKTINKQIIDNNIIITNDINEIEFSKIDLVFISADPNLNYTLSKFFLIKEKNVFVEKPLATKMSQVKEILNLSRQSKLILHVNYIHIYNNNFIKFAKYFQTHYNKNIYQQLIFHFGSDGPVRKDLNTLWDWGPHVFSCLLLLIRRFDEFVIKEMKIKENNHKGKLNFYIIGSFKLRLKIKIIFGNQFKKKKTIIVFKNNKNTYSYEDNRIVLNHKKIIKYHDVKDKKPLDFSINNLVNKINVKNFYHDISSLEITKILIMIEKQLVKLG